MFTYPVASVRWKKHPWFPIHRHHLIFGAVCALALLTGQVAFAISSIHGENQKCKDPNSGAVGNDGVCTCFNGYQHIHGSCEVDDFENSPKLRVSIEDEEVFASFDGSYGSDASDGTFKQDFVGGVVGGLKESSITMFGNAWKVYKFQEPLTIKKLTVLQFNFEAREKSEGNAICLEEDKNEDTYGGLKTRCVAIIMNDDMNQVSKWSNVKKVQVNGPGTYRVSVGSLFNDQTTQVQYLAFIQDNDSLPLKGKSTFSNMKIYEDTLPTVLSLAWNPVGKRDKDISTQSDRVSVSEDGKVAVYGSSGIVHLLQKSSSTSCKDGFPGCKVIQWNTWTRDGKTGYWSGAFSEEHGGYSSTVLQGISGIHCLGGNCDNKRLKYNGHEKVLEEHGSHWTGWFSEDAGGGKKECSNNKLVSRIQCRGGYCDEMRLLCSPALTGYRSTSVTMKTGLFSEEGQGTGYCSNGSYVYGIRCSGGYCDNIELYCRKLEKRQYPSLVHDDWTDYYALPSPEQLPSSPNKCPSGTEVPQIECHLAGITVGQQAGWNTLNWKVLHQSWSPTIHPCGCFISNRDQIVFNSNNSCRHHSHARLVCKSNTKIPTRAPDITIRPPEEIGPGNRFGEEVKVLSYDASIIAIAAPGATKIAVYSITYYSDPRPIYQHLGSDPDTSINKLVECQGDCDSDSDCAQNLVCFQRDGDGSGPPGCSGSTLTHYDYCYDITQPDNDATHFLKNVIQGYNPAISSGGKFIVTASAKSGSDHCTIDLFGRKNDNFLHEFTYAFSCDSISKGIAITHSHDGYIWLDTKDQSYNLSCHDNNAKLVIQSNIAPVICLCNDGFVNSGPNGGKILQDGFSCISSLRANNIMVTSDSVQFSMTNSVKDSYPETMLVKKSQPNDTPVSLTGNKFVKLGMDDKNIALGKPTSQSSLCCNGYASKAVDGNISGNKRVDGSVSHTTRFGNPWWRVDLQTVHVINSIVIFNRMDCCTERLRNFNLKVMNGNSKVWEYNHNGTPGHKTIIPVPTVTGSAVIVSLNRNEVLSLAEVQIFAPKQTSYKLSHLEPGSRYIVSLWSKAKVDMISFPVVTTCSCGNDNIDKTGRPDGMSTTQRNGHVMFTFTDNSLCEEGFSFTRSDYAEEFLADVSKYGVAFTRDYYFIGGRDCRSTISTGTDASDNLAISNLPVGKQYLYCVRAVHSSHYMDHPLDSLGEGRRMESSDDACAPHKIHWEASIHGNISTAPNAGSLPIKDVEVRWELMDTDNETPIGCKGCSGNSKTADGGTFKIVFNIDDPELSHNNDDNKREFPVRIKFSKMSGDIAHKFLCNNGENDCSGETGTAVFIKHLQFGEAVNIYDDTSVPFSGMVSVDNSDFKTEVRCPLSRVNVCLMKNNKVGSMDPIVCSETGSNGFYEIPIIIGSRVDDVQLSYHNHTFQSDGIFEKGTLIEEDGFYGNNDFKDVQKARLFVDVVGGLCDKRLGKSLIQIKMRRCPEIGSLTYNHIKAKDVYNSVPAHQLDVQVIDILKSDGEKNEKILKYFKDSSMIQTIDLRSTGIVDKSLEEENDSVLTKTTKGITNEKDVKNNELKNIAKMEKDEEENLELVRFQYDGDLKIDVQMLGDRLTCDNYDSTTYSIEDSPSSFHVLSSMKKFLIMVTFLYDLTEGLTCDIVDTEDLRLQITNNIGADRESDKDFLSKIEDEASKELLLKCADGCVQDIAHDTNVDGKLTNAHTSEWFAAGPPSAAAPFDKRMSLKVQTTSGNIVSTFDVISVVEGVISKGNARSFALPTHKPIMILRDPPGGLSYFSYRNIKTTFKFETKSTSTTINNRFSINSKLVTSVDAPMCSGGGGGLAGPFFAMCKKLLEAESTQQILGLTQATTHTTHMNQDTISYQLTTTWSYQTSQDPWLAGNMSDVFVVPNLNVPYEDVDIIEWDNSVCAVIMDGDNLPVTTTIFFDPPKSQPAVSFFSRYHVINIKLKEITKAIKSRQKTKANCKCDHQNPINNDECNCAELHEELTALQESDIEWKKALEYDNNFVLKPENSIINWFKETDALEHDKYDGEFGKLKSYAASSSSSALAPPVLASKSEWASSYLSDKDEDKEKPIETAKRIQFSGGGNKFSMNMQQEKVLNEVGLACWHGCNIDSNSDIRGPGLTDGLLKAFGNGVKLEFIPFDFNIHVSHDSTKGGSATESTTMELVLGDGDKGDEFVVDLYYDDKYGTVLFNTAGGQSKCPHEDGTDASENPILIIEDRPGNVFPNEEMIFRLSMQNTGLQPTTFSLDIQDRDNADGLKVALDGVPFGEMRDFWIPTTDKKYFKTLSIERGPYLYDYPPIDLIFKSTCGDVSKIVSEKIYNTYPDIKFVEPCPRVEWAGELNRDRDFLVNTRSGDAHNLVVRVFNPNHATGTFHSMTNTYGARLKSVKLEFRRAGRTDWKVADSNIEGGNGKLPVNFSLRGESSDENKSYYGYEEMDWKLPSTQGTYEIRVGSQCERINDAPTDINNFYAPILSGVIDLTYPKQYGNSLPLRDTVLIGEEITVVFTEALTCTKPYTFDIKLIIGGTDIKLGLGDPSLSVTCEGRKIGVQINPAEQDIDIDLIVGKSFIIKLSQVLDMNGNALENDGFIQVDKTFASTNLEQSSISFTLTIKAFNSTEVCKKADRVAMKEAVVSRMGMPTSEFDRLVVESMECIDEGKLIAELKILPNNKNRRKLRQDIPDINQSSDSALNMFYNIKMLSDDADVLKRARKLTVKSYPVDDDKWTFHLSNMKIIPPPSDIKMLETPPDLAEEEEKLLEIIRTSSIDGHRDNVVEKLSNNIYSLQKIQEKQQKIQVDQIHSMHQIHAEELHQMHKTVEDMTSMFIQMFVMAMGCMIILLVILYWLMNYDSNPDGRNDTIPRKLDLPAKCNQSRQ